MNYLLISFFLILTISNRDISINNGQFVKENAHFVKRTKLSKNKISRYPLYSKRQEDTLVLDDGTESSLFYTGKYDAQKFSPGVLCTLNSVTVKFTDTGGSCSLFVWFDSSGVPKSSLNLIPPIYFTATGPSWQRINLTSPISLNEDFWIGIFSDVVMHSDNTPNCHNRVAQSDDKNHWWVPDYHLFGEYLLRPIVTLTGPRHDVSCTNIFSKKGFFLQNPSNDTIGVVVKNFSNVTEMDVPVYLRVTDSLGLLAFFDVQYIDSIEHNEIDTLFFQWNYNKNGDYIIEGYPWLSNDCVRDNDKQEIESYIRTYPGELYYDDIEITWSGYSQYHIANKFYPPYYPCKIESVKLAFEAWATGTSYTFTYGMGAIIHDDDSIDVPGTEIAKDSVLGIVGPGYYWWFSMDFSNHNVVFDSGGFFIECFSIPDSTTPPYEPTLWVDDGNPPFAMMTWVKQDTFNWYHWWWNHSDAMIRVCVNYPSAVSENKKHTDFNNSLMITPSIIKGRFKCSFSIPENAKIEISIYSIDGRKVKSLLNTYVKKGLHYFYPDISDFSQGVYFIQMKSRGFIKNKKIILIK
jgi:hypothetical protein